MPTFKQLQYFREIAVSQNMSQVAERNYVSQTALSNSISRLEDEIGVKLFDRVGKKLVINTYGKAFLQYVESSMDILHNGISLLESMKSRESSEKGLSVGVSSSVLWGQMLSDFISQHPGLMLTQSEIDIDQVSRTLPNIGYSIIITGEDDLVSDQMDHQVFVTDRLYVFVPFNHRLAKEKSVWMEQLKDESFINMPPRSGFNKFCNKMFEMAGFKPSVVQECEYTMRRYLLRSGAGVAMSSYGAIRAGIFDNYGVPLRIKDDYAQRNMAMFWPKNTELSEQAQMFRHYVMEYYSDD